MVFLSILVIVNSLVGLLMFEWAWKKMKPFYNVNEERDSKQPSFRRYDAKNWKKWKFYPGALTILPAKVLLVISSMLLIYVVLKVLSIGYKY